MGMFPGDPGYSHDRRRDPGAAWDVPLAVVITRLRFTLASTEADVIEIERSDLEGVMDHLKRLEEIERQRQRDRDLGAEMNDALRRVTKGILRDGTERTETHHRADATAEDYPAASADGVQEAPQPAGSRPGGPGGPRGAFAGENRTRPPALETRPSSPRVYVADDIERSLRAHEMRLAALWVVGIVVAVTVYCLLTRQ